MVAGGCFWGVQGVYQHLKGVKSVLSGYAGGGASSADYETVEWRVIRGTPNRWQIVLRPLTGDPTARSCKCSFQWRTTRLSLNRQGPDSGTQYRSAIFYTNDTQKKIAEAYVAQLDQAALVYPEQDRHARSTPLKGFYEAEAYHQDYLIAAPEPTYIAYSDLPKVENLKKIFAENYIEKPTLVEHCQGHQLTEAGVSVIASEAKQSMLLQAGRWIASSLRSSQCTINHGEIYVRHQDNWPISRRAKPSGARN